MEDLWISTEKLLAEGKPLVLATIIRTRVRCHVRSAPR